MRRYSTLTILLVLLGIQTLAARPRRILDAPAEVSRWLVHDGQVIGVVADQDLYLLDNEGFRLIHHHEDLSSVELSENGEFLVAVMNEAASGEREQTHLQSEYIVFNRRGEVIQRAHQTIRSDEKRYQVAISDEGALALVDPLYLYMHLYADGQVVTEGQLFKLEGNRSLERRVRLWWDSGVLFVLLERPAANGGAALPALLLRVNRKGVQLPSIQLPVAYLLDTEHTQRSLFISGYNYDARAQTMRPMIFALNKAGKLQWTHASYGHELTLSSNQRYLGALVSDAQISVFDLQEERWQRFYHGVTGTILKGITVLDDGIPLAFVIDKRFFARRQPAPVIIFHGAEGEIGTIDMEPAFPGLFQLYSRGTHCLTGTRYEWLEINI